MQLQDSSFKIRIWSAYVSLDICWGDFLLVVGEMDFSHLHPPSRGRNRVNKSEQVDSDVSNTNSCGRACMESVIKQAWVVQMGRFPSISLF